MTREEAILLSAYTGFLLVQDFSDVHKFCEDTLGRPIWTHEFADEDVRKEIQDKLRPQIMKLIQSTNALRADLARVTAERDAAVEAVKNMAEYIVCAGRVDYYLCDEISQEHHLKYQPKNDGNYDNEPCYKCIADWFLQGHKWQENCW